MRTSARRSVLAGVVLACQILWGCTASGDDAPSPGRSRQLFDFGWRFHAGDVGEGQLPGLDDRGWQAVDLPHDFAIAGEGSAPFGGLLKVGPFDRASPADAAGGYLDAGTAWYRKNFTVSASEQGRRVFVDFDGVYMASTVWLNGRSLGVRDWSGTSDLHLSWQVPYEPGTLEAVAKRDGVVVATETLTTPGRAARVVLQVDRPVINADGEDVAYVTVRVTDADGNRCPLSGAEITYDLSGGGSIAGLGDGDPTNLEPFHGDTHRVFHGLGLAIIRAPTSAAEMTLTASAPGLESATVSIEAAR